MAPRSFLRVSQSETTSIDPTRNRNRNPPHYFRLPALSPGLFPRDISIALWVYFALTSLILLVVRTDLTQDMQHCCRY